MFTAGIFTFIGIALLLKARKADKDVNLTDIWTEFAGDGIQKIIEKIIDFVQNSTEKKKLTKIIENSFDINSLYTYKSICREVKEKETKSSLANNDGIVSKIKNKVSEFKDKITGLLSRKTIDIKFICSLSEAVIYELDYETYLTEYSRTFANLEENKKVNFTNSIKLVVDIYRKDIFARTSEEVKVMTSLIIYSIKDFIDNKNSGLLDELEKRIETRFLQIAQTSDGINYQKIKLSKYVPQYILKACPGCGYSGARIYVNEKTNTVHCAACGKEYSIIRYCEPEYWKELKDKLTKLESNSGEAQKKFELLLEYCGNDLAEIKHGLEQVATKNYLETCMRENFESFIAMHKSAQDDAEAFIKEYYSEICLKMEEVESETAELKSQIIKCNEQYKVHNIFLCKKLNSYSEQLNQVYNFAQKEFLEMGVKSDLILQYIQKLFSKEYLEDMSYSLGTNLKNAISFNAEHVVALNTSSISQILAAIEDLKINWDRLRDRNTKADSADSDKTAAFERLIYDQTAQLSGQVNGLQELIRNNNAEYGNAFRAIISSQEEIKNILLSKVSLAQDPLVFEKMYSGKIPSRYLYNEGFGGVFPCPYCGTMEERIINDEQYCRCSVCGQKFLAVDLSLELNDIDPFCEMNDTEAKTLLDIIAKKYGRSESDPLLATKEKVEKWRQKRTLTIATHKNGEKSLILKEQSSNDRIIILPQAEGNNPDTIMNYGCARPLCQTVKIIIVPYGYTTLNGAFFDQFLMLNTVVVQCKNGKSSIKNRYLETTIPVSIKGNDSCGFPITRKQ